MTDKEEYKDTLLVDGMSDAFMGYAQIFNKYIAVYDKSKVINTLITRDGMSYEEAHEFFDFNIVGAYMGENTPAFLETNNGDDYNG